MNSDRRIPGPDTVVKARPEGKPTSQPRFAYADRLALQGIFHFLCIFALYLMLVQVYGAIFQPGRLVSALAQFIPYCLVLAAVIYRGRALAKWDQLTMLMVACLGSVFLVFTFDVTKNLKWFDGVPILGRDSPVRNDLASLAIMVAVASFPAASYLMMQELLQAKHRLDEQVDKLEEALRHVQRLQGLLPICMYCHKIRTDQQSWQRIENYIIEHSDASFTHSLCPECAEKHFPGITLHLSSRPAPRPAEPAPKDG